MRAFVVIALIVAVVWCAGNALMGALSAPAIFSFAPPHATHIEKDFAGAQFGEILRRWTLVVDMSLWPVLATITLITFGAWLIQRRFVTAIAIFVLMLATSGLHLWSRATLHETIAKAPPLDRSSEYTPEQRHVFTALHASSERLFKAETVLLLLYVLGMGLILSQKDTQPPASAEDDTD